MRNNRQLRRLGAALVAFVLIFGLMTVTARERSEVTVLEKAIATLLYPLQVATDWVAGQFRGVGQSIEDLANLRKENVRLRQEVQAASQLQAQIQQLRVENQNLQSELTMKQATSYPLLTADVISRTSENWYRTVIINRGSRDGVQQNMAVVNWQGLVGKVSHTTPFTATVQLLIDAGFGQSGFGAGAKLPTRELGFIETTKGGHVRMRFFSSEPTASIGQPVFTSGQAVLPPDLLIGYVESMGSPASAFEKYVDIKPAVDFRTIDVVHVVLFDTDRDRGANAP